MKITAILMVCAVLLGGVCASASVDTYDSTLSGLLGDVPLHAEAACSDGMWTYTYTLDISGLTDVVTGLSVGNMQVYPFFGATNNRNFIDPSYTQTDSVFWYGGLVEPGDGPIVFGFQSHNAPAIVNATLWGGPAFPSGGVTLGMSSLGIVTPEPSGFMGLMMCSVGAVGSLRALRRSKR